MTAPKLKLYIMSLCIILVTGLQAKAQDSFSGFIQAKKGSFCLAKTANFANCQSIKALNEDTTDILGRLKTGDYVVGTGQTINSVLVVDQIEFVGLRQLLGVWKGGDSLLRFTNFSSVTTSLLSSHGIDPDANLQYSISPDTANSWRVLFAGSEKVTAALLTLQANDAQLQFIDAGSGEITQSYRLQKIQDY